MLAVSSSVRLARTVSHWLGRAALVGLQARFYFAGTHRAPPKRCGSRSARPGGLDPFQVCRRSNSRSVRIFDSLLAPGIFASPVPPARRALHLLDPTDVSNAEYVTAHSSSLCRIPQPGSRPRNTRL